MSIRVLRSLVAGIATLLMAAGVTPVFAQAPVPRTMQEQPGAVITQPPRQEGVPGTAQTLPAPQQAARAQLNHALSQLLITSNQGEVKVSQFGQDHAQSQQVRNFAQNMVKEHHDFINKLQKAAASVASTQAAPAPGTPATTPGATVQGIPSAGRAAVPGATGTPIAPGVVSEQGAAGSQQVNQLVQILGQAGNRNVELTQGELANKHGIEFDQAFMGDEIAAHLRMLSALETFGPHTSGQLQQVINQGVNVTKKHLGEARSIMQGLEQARVQQAGKPKGTKHR